MVSAFVNSPTWAKNVTNVCLGTTSIKNLVNVKRAANVLSKVEMLIAMAMECANKKEIKLFAHVIQPSEMMATSNAQGASTNYLLIRIVKREVGSLMSLILIVEILMFKCQVHYMHSVVIIHIKIKHLFKEETVFLIGQQGIG